MKKNKLSVSKKNYIKVISEIVHEKQAARVKDISGRLDIGASSVTEALKSLSEEGYVNYEPYGIITLSQKGQNIAGELQERHRITCDFLKNVLLVEDKYLDESAQQIEYGIEGNLLDKFVNFFHFTQICPCKNPKWLQGYKNYTLNGNSVNEKCSSCISYCEENNLVKPFSDNNGKSCCTSCN